jgi:phosphatidylinositol 3-kinase
MKLVRKFAVSKLDKLDYKKINFILLQLVQALKYEDNKDSPLTNFLIEKCSNNIELATSFYWFLKVEKDNSDQKGKKDKEEPKIITIYKEIFNNFVEKIKNNEEIFNNIQRQEEFHNNLLKISSELTKYKKAESKKNRVREILNNTEDGLGKEMIKNYPLPLYPRSEVCGTEPEKCTVFASAKCPVKYEFKITQETAKYLKKDKDDEDKHSNYGVIFKNGDDIRQDQLILQIISFMDTLLRDVQLNFEFTTYKVLATSKESGFVEFVGDSDTIFNILKKDKKIEQYIKKYSSQSEQIFQQHLKSYIISCAGYCVVTYLLAIGDRHLENLMIDQKGKLFHIDFGYILGKDPKPYPPPIKICNEMVECINDKEEFKNLCVKCFLILRNNARLIVNMFYLMKDSGIPEVNNIDNLNKLYNRFESELTTQQAANALMSKIEDSLSALAPKIFEKIHSWAVYWK